MTARWPFTLSGGKNYFTIIGRFFFIFSSRSSDYRVKIKNRFYWCNESRMIFGTDRADSCQLHAKYWRDALQACSKNALLLGFVFTSERHKLTDIFFILIMLVISSLNDTLNTYNRRMRKWLIVLWKKKENDSNKLKSWK